MKTDGDKMNLIVSALKKGDKSHKEIIEILSKKLTDIECVYTEDMNIKGCSGCNCCWLMTPGVCAIKDDYKDLLIKFLQAKQVIFITESQVGFVSYQFKNIIDRLLPLATMHLRFKNGQMRHYSRYKKHFQMGLIYKGNGNKEFLDKWFQRVMLNFEGTSLGAYHIENKEAILNAFTHH